MSWFSTNETFPPAVRQAQLPAGTRLQERYELQEAVRVCGTELTYLAKDLETQEMVYLRELLPMRWCMRGEDALWTPYHEEAAKVFESIISACRTKMEQLQPFHEETALEHILAVFEAYGTLWTVTECTEQQSLADALAMKLFTPQEAISLIAPVMDTLAGLHAELICHGAVSAHTIVLCGDTAVLTGWCSRLSDETAQPPSAYEDVQGICRLLYRMMTGEQVYSSQTAAALPSGIRRALKNGMERTDMTMEQLWKKLHADRPSKRTSRMKRRAGNPVLGRIFSPAFTIIFCILCCALPILIIAANKFSGGLQDASYTLSNEEIRVPELLYLSQEEAVQTAEALGLHVIIAAREDNPVVEANLVVTQKPSAGSVLTAGETVQLTVSDGWSNYVPNVCNMLREEAAAALEALGFIVECEEVLSAGDAPGTVISQSVKPETDLARDSVIRLKISLGRKDLDTKKLETVGNYVGMEFEEAKQLLSELYLYAFQAEAVHDPLVPEGVIISQEIPEGSRVPQGTMINMVVSLGVETVRVPHVELMNVNSARAMLESAGLKAVVTYSADPGFAAECVISQGTPSGELVPIGSEIWLTVSTGNSNTVVSTGGWSGAPLPTFDTTEESVTETAPSESESTETLPTETDPSETDTTETSEQETASTEETDTTESTADSSESTEPAETSETQLATETETTQPLETAAPTTEPTEAPTPAETQDPTPATETAAAE